MADEWTGLGATGKHVPYYNGPKTPYGRVKTRKKPAREVPAGKVKAPLGADHPVVREGRTQYPRTRKRFGSVATFKSGEQNRKVGSRFVRGPSAGKEIHVLNLEERATCSRGCHAWRYCYGNTMPLAHRIEHGPELEAGLADEVDKVIEACRAPHGVAFRLHGLGDFYSVGYVERWIEIVAARPEASVFGFTAHSPKSEIGAAVVAGIRELGWDRFGVRFSVASASSDLPRAKVFERLEDVPFGWAPCNAQTGASANCGECGLCLTDVAGIAFVRH